MTKISKLKLFVITLLWCVFALNMSAQSTQATIQSEAISLYVTHHKVDANTINVDAILETTDENLVKWKAVAEAYKDDESEALQFVNDVIEGMSIKLSN